MERMVTFFCWAGVPPKKTAVAPAA
jgi:hypothetical protein